MTLRETIAEAMWNAEGSQGTIGGPHRWDGMKPEDIALDMMDTYRLEAAAAIAAFSEALLSEAAIEAAAEAEHKRMWQGAYSPFTWAEEDTGIQDGIRDSTRETLKAALAAITAPAGDGTG